MAGQEGESLKAMAVLGQARGSRDAIRGYHLVVTSSMRIALSMADPSKIDQESTRYEVWRDGDKVRTDVVKTESTYDPQGVDRRRIVCRNCERPGFALDTTISPKSITPVKYNRIDAQFDTDDAYRIDWRRLGLLHADLSQYTVQTSDATLLAFEKAPRVTAERVALDGHSAVRVVVTGPNGAGSSCWLRPDLGMNPVKFETVAPMLRGGQETVIEYTRHEAAGVWFPSAVNHTRIVDGKRILDQRLVIEKAEINRPVPAEVFTLVSFGLKDGTPIEVPEATKVENQPTWQKGKVDRTRTRGQQAAESYHHLQQTEPPVPASSEPRGRWAYFVGATVLALAGGIAVAVAARRRTIP